MQFDVCKINGVKGIICKITRLSNYQGLIFIAYFYMPSFLQKILYRPVTWAAEKFSSKPDKERIFSSLSELYKNINETPGKKGLRIEFDSMKDKFIIFSDQHKGAKDGSDDFAIAEKNYCTALEYYNQNNYTYINLGDGEEFWENTLAAVKKNNTLSFDKEKLFAQQNKFIKIFGNHDLYWGNDPFASIQLESIYKQKVAIYEGAILSVEINKKPLDIFLTHGHQGDKQSDGNWFSKWFVANVWAPLQSYLHINPNTPAFDDQLKTAHNALMYEWSDAQKNLLLITGHTHQPVFTSLTHIERLYRKLSDATHDKLTDLIKQLEIQIAQRKIKGHLQTDFSKVKPSYFNSGCCCFSDGDITGIEITEGMIRLIKWEYIKDQCVREVMEETTLDNLANQLG